MAKKIDWLEKFAEDQAKKMRKTANLNKKAEQVIVDPEDVDGEIAEGSEVMYKEESYKVVDANFSDDFGPGIIIEKAAIKEAAFGDEDEELEEVEIEGEVELEEEIELEDEVEFEEEVEIEDEVELEKEVGIEDEVEVEIEDEVEVEVEDEVELELEDEVEVEDEVELEDVVPSAPNAPEMQMQMGTDNVPSGNGKSQEYHRTDPGHVYHMEVRDDVEQPAFEDAARQTEQQIAEENSIDKTTPEGRYSNNRVFNRMMEGFEGPVEESTDEFSVE
ncbi:MAG: hypothetical protein ACOCRK_01355 [bacterium]